MSALDVTRPRADLLAELAGRTPTVPNPMVRAHGPEPEGAQCKQCKHITCHIYSRRFYKCAMRGISGGPATDHRLSWQACAKFEEEK